MPLVARELRKRNCRDMACLINEEGLRLKEGVFFRSGKLYKLKEKERAFYESLGLKTIIDLRTEGEIGKKPDETIEGAENVHLPVLTEATLGITHEKGLKAYKEPPKMRELYAKIVTEESSSAILGEALRKILSLEDGPRLWHCTAGKDRAGILTALFLSALGYKREDIMADYLLSDKPNRKRGVLYQFLITVFIWKPRVARTTYWAMRAIPDYLNSAFNAMEKECGSVMDYIHERLGIMEEHLAAFKAKFMEPAV